MSTIRSRRALVALAVAVAVLVGGCGGGDDGKKSAKAAGTESGATTTSAPAAAAGDDAAATASSSGSGDVAAGGIGTQAATGEQATDKPPTLEEFKELYGIDVSKFDGDWVAGKPKGRSNDDPRPPNCTFKVNQMCQMQVVGRYQLKSQDVAQIQVGVYENGATEPAFHTELPNARKGGSPWYIDKFPYVRREGINHIEVLVKLLDPAGKEIARSDPTVYPAEVLEG